MNRTWIGVTATLALGLPYGGIAHEQETHHHHTTHSSTATTHESRLAEHIARTYHISHALSREIVDDAFEYGRTRHLDPYLILAIIAQESSFKPSATGKRGDVGLMQVLPSAHPDLVRSVGGLRQLYVPRKNIEIGSLLLSQFMHLARGDRDRALTMYNGGGRHYAKDVMSHYYRLKRY